MKVIRINIKKIWKRGYWLEFKLKKMQRKKKKEEGINKNWKNKNKNKKIGVVRFNKLMLHE